MSGGWGERGWADEAGEGRRGRTPVFAQAHAARGVELLLCHDPSQDAVQGKLKVSWKWGRKQAFAIDL